MTLEEIKALDDETLGRLIADAIEWKTKRFTVQEIRDRFSFHSNSPLWFFKLDVWEECSSLVDDLNLIARAEDIIAERNLHSDYGDNINKIAVDLGGQPNPKLRGNWIWHLATASARQKAEAILLTLQN